MTENAIISDLEFAPQLTDDMVFAVEDTQSTYSATLGALRNQLNKVFVEVKDVDFNTLVDDGFYQASGSLTNTPIVGSSTWLLQVMKSGEIIVQTAFSNDVNNYLNVYRRRWNGTSWNSWQAISVSLSALYPVGSLFFSTASTCPLQALGIGTWQNVGTSLTLSVDTSVSVVGNGMTLGLTDGTTNFSLSTGSASGGLVSGSSGYGKSVGTARGSGDHVNSNKFFGVATNPTKSGIVGTVTRTQITVNIFQRIS